MSCCFFFKRKTAYEVRISDWSSDVCSSDLHSPAFPCSPAALQLWRACFSGRLMRKLDPISIGPVQIGIPVILAPMTGVTDMPFRTLVRRYGSGLNVTEMIASQAMIRETRQSLQKAAWHPAEEPVSMQLAGCSPSGMARPAKRRGGK